MQGENSRENSATLLTLAIKSPPLPNQMSFPGIEQSVIYQATVTQEADFEEAEQIHAPYDEPGLQSFEQILKPPCKRRRLRKLADVWPVQTINSDTQSEDTTGLVCQGI